MNFWQLVSIGFVGMILSQLLKQIAPQIYIYSSVAVSILLTVAALLYVQPAIDFAVRLSLNESFKRIPSVMLKLCAIAVITGLASDICWDAGESAIAGRIELLGKCACIATVLPVLEAVAEYAKDFLT